MAIAGSDAARIAKESLAAGNISKDEYVIICQAEAKRLQLQREEERDKRQAARQKLKQRDDGAKAKKTKDKAAMSGDVMLLRRCISYAIGLVVQQAEAKAKRRGPGGGASMTIKDYKARVQSAPFLFDQDMEEGVRFNMEDYAPLVFRAIREHYGITAKSYLTSLCGAPLSGGAQGEGKSGMYFFMTQDKRYILKTLKSSELPFFIKMLKDYHWHIRNWKHTLLPRFFGVYKIKLHAQPPVRLIVMNNLFDTSLPIQLKYDLKGSTVKRWVTDEEQAAGCSVLKDLNFSCDGLSQKDLPKNAPRLHGKMHVGNAPVDADGCAKGVPLRSLMIQHIKTDVDFMKNHDIMDYSLLLGIAKLDPAAAKRTSLDTGVGDATKTAARSTGKDGQFRSIFQVDDGGLRGRAADQTPLDELYYFGIIDILQEYDVRKRMEHMFKSRKQAAKGGDPSAISAVASSTYAARFLMYLKQNVEPVETL